ncbi:LytR family transcriptional regulator [Sinomonas cellulolyticus]|nr:MULTISPECIES: LCP family protein [Sinomonas]GHG39973.1 LytR family transcriptional regulator [Sinomonas sp. KCTC 49339]
MALLMIAGLAFAGYWFIRLGSNLRQAPLSAGNATADAANDATDRLQILIMGTDTRDGANGEYGSQADSSGYGNSDVMILMDISADNKQISMTSFPRDLMVPIPSCTDPKTHKTFPAQNPGQLNSAMQEAGPGCLLDAVNKMTGLTVDHFLLADFNAVKELSNTIGGVDVCVNAAIDDPYSGLKLHAGTNTVMGEQALAFLRSRHGVGDGSDLSRIKSQQAFLASLARKVRSDGTLTNVPKMLSIADTITKNLTVDSGLANPQSLITIGNRLKDVDLSKVAFVTVPWEPWTQDPNRIQLKEPDASGLFDALRAGRDLTAPAPAAPAASSAPAASAPAASPSAPPYDKAIQPVAVANGSGAAGRAQALVELLKTAGFTQTVAFAAAPVSGTSVYYSAGFQDVATDVAAQFGIPASQVQPSTAIHGVQLYVGSDFASGDKYTPKVPDNIVSQTAAQQTCQTAAGQ